VAIGARNSGQQDQMEPEFTTRPRRLLLMGRMQPGQEMAVLEAQLRFPYEAAAGAGINAVEGFVGSGNYALLLEIDGDDAQKALAAFLNDPRVREFHASLRPYVSGLPLPGQQYVGSDLAHERAAAGEARGTPSDPFYSSADLPLAASIYRWSSNG
jgi:hypothetical protein